MHIDLHFEMRGGYLYAQGAGTFSLDETLDAFIIVLETVVLHQATKVLIVMFPNAFVQ